MHFTGTSEVYKIKFSINIKYLRVLYSNKLNVLDFVN